MRMLPALGLLLTVTPAAAAPPFVDDRSGAAELVGSLYNAINRKEYARAWSYFSDPPAKSFEAFVNGYADTEEVEISIGTGVEEGAAGSIFASVPVALQAMAGGESRYFRGCYTVRAINGTIQEPPYRPLSITAGKLSTAAEGDLADLARGACDGLPAPDIKAELLDLFRREHGRVYRTECALATQMIESGDGLSLDRLEWRYAYQGADETPNEGYLLTAPCDNAAYNTTENYYFWEKGRGFERLSFAAPDFDVLYADDNNEKLDKLVVKGFAADTGLVNSSFDSATGTLSSFSKWRGIGDAFSAGQWRFWEGRFILQNYEVDPTYDGESESVAVIRDGMLLPLP
jgi:hypothetical protein